MDDPVTPLLSQWTYQAMVHQLLGVKNNRVNLLPDAAGSGKSGNKENKQTDIVISSHSDGFFKENMYANYGDLGMSIKKLVDDFQAVSKMNKQIDSIEDMQRFVESFPEFRQQSGNVSKHVALMSELSRIIGEDALMAVSQVEQEIACGTDRTYAYNAVIEQLSDHKVKPAECLRLVLLFALRYEKEGARQVDEMVARLVRRDVESSHIRLVKQIINCAGENTRTGDLFGNRNFFARASKLVGGLKGADNVYTQHQPLLAQTLENLYKGKMKEVDYPIVSGGGGGGAGGGGGVKAQDVLVFVIGGVTYEEAKFVAEMNNNNNNNAQSQSGAGAGGVYNVTLGGTTILNSKVFLRDMTKALC